MFLKESISTVPRRHGQTFVYLHTPAFMNVWTGLYSTLVLHIFFLPIDGIKQADPRSRRDKSWKHGMKRSREWGSDVRKLYRLMSERSVFQAPWKTILPTPFELDQTDIHPRMPRATNG